MFTIINSVTTKIAKIIADRRDDQIAQRLADDQYEQHLDRLKEAEMAETNAVIEAYFSSDQTDVYVAPQYDLHVWEYNCYVAYNYDQDMADLKAEHQLEQAGLN